MVPISEEELQNRVDSAIEEIYYPMFDVCEDILVGLVSSDIAKVGASRFTLKVAGIELVVTKEVHRHTGLKIVPDITGGWGEYKLLARCINVYIHLETDGKARSQVIQHYDEKESEFE
jgi:hypothetical protein